MRIGKQIPVKKRDLMRRIHFYFIVLLLYLSFYILQEYKLKWQKISARSQLRGQNHHSLLVTLNNTNKRSVM